MEKYEYLNVGPGGTFKPSGNPDFDSIPANVEKLFEKMKFQNKKHLVIHFHGGLVNENVGMETALRMHDLYSNETKAQPYAFIWETGLIETLRDNLKNVHQTKLFQLLLKMVIKKVGEKLGVTIGGKGTVHISEPEYEIEMAKDKPFEDFIISSDSKAAVIVEINDPQALERELELDFNTMMEMNMYSGVSDELEKEKKSLNKENLSDAEDPNAKGIITTLKAAKALASVGIRVIKRILKNRDHGFYPTVIEEIFREFYIADLGSMVWSSMKTKASDMWKDNTGLNDLDQHAGTYFLNKLKEFSNEFSKINDITVDLVGHSAGSIVICNLLKAIDEQGFNNINIRKVIFLAPACRCDIFYTEIINHKNRYKDFMMYTMTDELESDDMLIPGIYTRSLLYFVSGCLEDHGKGFDEFILGLQRHITNEGVYNNFVLLKSINTFLNEKENRVIYSPSDLDKPEGFRSVSASHGDFDNLADKHGNPLYTLQSLAWQINN